MFYMRYLLITDTYLFAWLLNSVVLFRAEYTMGGFQQRPWTPTKRRGPIAAEFKGPGPACVSLPSSIGKFPTVMNTYEYF